MMKPSKKKPRRATRRRCGRPTKLNASVQKKIVDVLGLGYPLQTAADYVGLHPSTLYDWLKRGARAKKGPFAEFNIAVMWVRFSARIERWIASGAEQK